MKKITVMIMSLVLAISLLGCKETAQTQTPSKPTTGDNSQVEVNRSLKNCKTLAEYEKYVAAMPKNSKFITYDMLKEYGEFSYYVTPDYNKIPELYKYDFKTDEGPEWRILISHEPHEPPLYITWPPDEKKPIVFLTELPEDGDLRYNDATDILYTGYMIEGVRYNYYYGKLAGICWTTDTHYFDLQAVEGILAEVKVDEDSFLGRLMKVETAPEAIREFNDKLPVKG